MIQTILALPVANDANAPGIARTLFIAQASRAEIVLFSVVYALVAGEGLPAERATLLAGRPETMLASLAERGEADLLVLGAASRGRIKEFFVGSTAERLLHETETDMLIVKAPRTLT